MTAEPLPLTAIFEGWDGYQTSIVHAIEPLTPEQITWRPTPGLRSVGEVASHIAIGRIEWFARMPAPSSLDLKQKAAVPDLEKEVAQDKESILQWMISSWQMIDATLHQWTTADLSRSFRHAYQGQVYAVSFHWVIWRILTHDIHHGGELALMLGMQGTPAFELGDLFGHLTIPPLDNTDSAERND